MRFEVSEQEAHRAKIPHELFLTNLIANHILMFVAALGVAGSVPYPLAMVPIISLSILSYTLWRARKALKRDPWFVASHWQVAAKRSMVFIFMLLLLGTIVGFGWLGYTYLGLMKVAVLALIGGVGILPTMVTVLILIIMESDALHQARDGKLPKWAIERYPNPGVRVLDP